MPLFSNRLGADSLSGIVPLSLLLLNLLNVDDGSSLAKSYVLYYITLNKRLFWITGQ